MSIERELKSKDTSEPVLSLNRNLGMYDKEGQRVVQVCDATAVISRIAINLILYVCFNLRTNSVSMM